jgi:hypothetical protein
MLMKRGRKMIVLEFGMNRQGQAAAVCVGERKEEGD